MRGAQGTEKDITIHQFWKDVRAAELEYRIDQTFRSLLHGFRFAEAPSLYCRFTFTVQNVTTRMSAGSPKVILRKAGKVSAWFLASGLSYTLEGAKTRAEKAIDDINQVVREAGEDAIFFLEFVTCRAYVVKQ